MCSYDELWCQKLEDQLVFHQVGGYCGTEERNRDNDDMSKLVLIVSERVLWHFTWEKSLQVAQVSWREFFFDEHSSQKYYAADESRICFNITREFKLECCYVIAVEQDRRSIPLAVRMLLKSWNFEVLLRLRCFFRRGNIKDTPLKNECKNFIFFSNQHKVT